MDKELEYRLARIEEKLTTHTASGVDSDFAKQQADDEIDLRELWNVIWAGRIKIIAITAAFAVASVIYALSLPNMYKSEIILAPAQTDGLAAMAGINLGGGDSSRIEQAVQLLKSWPFLEAFWQQHNLKPQIMAVEGWDKKNNKLQYNYDVYNPETKQWTIEVDEGENPEPTSWQTYKAINSMITVSNDAKTGMLTIAAEHLSADVAYNWVQLLKQQLNSFYQQQDMQEAQKNIDYLKGKIAETNVTDMQAVFYNMIESQTKTLMLAEVSDQYLVKTVVPAKVAEEKSKPRRAVICIVGVLLGGFVSLLFVLAQFFLKNKE